MYICSDCGCKFEEPDSSFNRVGERYTDGYYISVCPNCGADEIEEAEECVHCHEYHSPSDLSEGLCDECKEEIMHDIFTAVRERYGDNEDVWTWIQENLLYTLEREDD